MYLLGVGLYFIQLGGCKMKHGAIGWLEDCL